ncbi:MAG: hypothetical protein K6E97_04020 [Treponema sp.]|nr:hypothetical protein [Treponema sp.]
MKKTLTIIGSVLLTIILTVAAVFIVLFKKNNKEEKEKAEKAKEDKKNELEEKTADAIAADSPNHDTISTNIKREQEELRKRLRDRFDKKLHREGSSTDN